MSFECGCRLALACAALCVLPTISLAATRTCKSATAAYKSLASTAIANAQAYAACVAASDGTNDCAAVFEKLVTAQSNFGDAVADYRLACK